MLTLDLFADLETQPVIQAAQENRPMSATIAAHRQWWSGLTNQARINAIRNFRHDDPAMTFDDILAAIRRGEALHQRGANGEWQKIYTWNEWDKVLIETEWASKATRRVEIGELPAKLGPTTRQNRPCTFVFYRVGDVPVYTA